MSPRTNLRTALQPVCEETAEAFFSVVSHRTAHQHFLYAVQCETTHCERRTHAYLGREPSHHGSHEN